MNIHPRNFGALTVLTMLLLTGCGGGGGGGSSPAAPTGGTSNPPAAGDGTTGGTTRTGVAVAVGPITGFGSVIVGGNTYDTDAATFTKDGQAATQDDFSVGQMVLIQGTIDDDNTNAVATSVDFEDNVEGPVSSVDGPGSRLTVLGQTVLITANTSIDDNAGVDACPALLDDFVDEVVEVSGPVLADGSIEATRIECRSVAGDFEVTGVVTNLNASAFTFMINALEVDYTEALLQNFPNATITAGDPVEAKGEPPLGGNGELIATSVEFKGNRFAENEGDHVEVEGFITRYVSATDFDVSNIPVTTISGTTVFEGGTADDLSLNLKVEAEGDFNDVGVLSATKIEIKQATAVRVTGLVDNVAGDTVQILGITITTDTVTTRFEDKLGEFDPYRIGNVNTGDYLEIRGQESPPGEIFAFLVERDDPKPETELRGFVEVGDEPFLTVLGVTIQTDADTTFRDGDELPLQSEEFWAAAGEGSLIDVKGTETGPNTLLAEEVELELE